MLGALGMNGTLRTRGFTLIELMVVIAVVGVILTLAAPSFSSLILMQRLKGINAQVVTDLQYARSEAVARGVPVYVKFAEASPSTPTSCYILYTSTIPPTNPVDPAAPSCDCAAAEGSRCTDPATVELRTVQVPASSGVFIASAGNLLDSFSFDPRTGGMAYLPSDSANPLPPPFSIEVFADNARKLRDVVGVAGRVKVCIPTGSTMAGDPC